MIVMVVHIIQILNMIKLQEIVSKDECNINIRKTRDGITRNG